MGVRVEKPPLKTTASRRAGLNLLGTPPKMIEPTGRLVEIERLGPATFPTNWRVARRAGDWSLVDPAVRVRVRADWPLPPDHEELWFERAGPRRWLRFDPTQTKAAIVTCGGLCPGLNNVIRSVYLELTRNYGVPTVLGIRHGYLGLTAEGPPPEVLTMERVGPIHRMGGTILGSSRGQRDTAEMAATLERLGISMLFCVGGDGTQRGALAIGREIRAHGKEIAVVGIPKTIDNDLMYTDRTFGFDTAIQIAHQVIQVAHTEAKAGVRGIGLVKLMGRDSGFIAAMATLACQEVNVTLIPEVPFRLEGEEGLLAVLERRLDQRGHAVVVVAEGAGQDLFEGGHEALGFDASGNRRYHDIGLFLKERITDHFKAIGKPADLKYLDPSYIIRSTPAICTDSALCDQLGRDAVHAALAGMTNVVVTRLNNLPALVPMEMTVSRKRVIDPQGPIWTSVLAATGQPPLLR